MALLPMRPCPVPGCPEYSRGGGRCEKHSRQQQKEQAERRGSAASRGYTHTWSKVRRSYLRKNPLCSECLDNGITKAAEVVHHINDNARDNRLDNLQSLCRECHESKHKRF